MLTQERFSEPSGAAISAYGSVLSAEVRAGRYDGVGQQPIAKAMELIRTVLVPERRLVHQGDYVYRVGDSFTNLHVVNTGIFKIVHLAADGREQLVGLKFRGDWLGLDGIADNVHACEAVAMDTGEVWVFRYQQFLQACAATPMLMAQFNEAMGRLIAQGRDRLMSVCTLSADARVAHFLYEWAQALAMRGLRTDQISLCLTRAEIGNHLGMTLESVSRAFAHMDKLRLISFPERGRRDIAIPCLESLRAFVQHGVPAAAPLLH